MSTAIATSVTPGLSSYSISKLAVIRLSEYIAAEYGNVSSVALQPGVVDTDLVVGKCMTHFAGHASVFDAVPH
jgi:NAD(P)-dependent dehydrogenase (short-subunit alcohol dehydrogenase family)